MSDPIFFKGQVAFKEQFYARVNLFQDLKKRCDNNNSNRTNSRTVIL